MLVMWGTRILRVSFAVLLMCGARIPRACCVFQQRWFSVEIAEVSHDKSMKAPSPRKWNLIVNQTLCEDCWWEICYTSRYLQTRTEEAAHQVNAKKQEKVENELMNLTRGGQCTETVECVDPERPKKSDDSGAGVERGNGNCERDANVRKGNVGVRGNPLSVELSFLPHCSFL